jgi:hypothetical protein
MSGVQVHEGDGVDRGVFWMVFTDYYHEPETETLPETRWITQVDMVNYSWDASERCESGMMFYDAEEANRISKFLETWWGTDKVHFSVSEFGP